MRIKLLICSHDHEIITKRLIYIPKTILSIGELSNYLHTIVQLQCSSSNQIFKLSVDDFDLSNDDPIHVLNSDDVVRLEMIESSEFNSITQQHHEIFGHDQQELLLQNNEKTKFHQLRNQQPYHDPTVESQTVFNSNPFYKAYYTDPLMETLSNYTPENSVISKLQESQKVLHKKQHHELSVDDSLTMEKYQTISPKLVNPYRSLTDAYMLKNCLCWTKKEIQHLEKCPNQLKSFKKQKGTGFFFSHDRKRSNALVDYDSDFSSNSVSFSRQKNQSNAESVTSTSSISVPSSYDENHHRHQLNCQKRCPVCIPKYNNPILTKTRKRHVKEIEPEFASQRTFPTQHIAKKRIVDVLDVTPVSQHQIITKNCTNSGAPVSLHDVNGDANERSKHLDPFINTISSQRTKRRISTSLNSSKRGTNSSKLLKIKSPATTKPTLICTSALSESSVESVNNSIPTSSSEDTSSSTSSSCSSPVLSSSSSSSPSTPITSDRKTSFHRNEASKKSITIDSVELSNQSKDFQIPQNAVIIDVCGDQGECKDPSSVEVCSKNQSLLPITKVGNQTVCVGDHIGYRKYSLLNCQPILSELKKGAVTRIDSDGLYLTIRLLEDPSVCETLAAEDLIDVVSLSIEGTSGSMTEYNTAVSSTSSTPKSDISSCQPAPTTTNAETQTRIVEHPVFTHPLQVTVDCPPEEVERLIKIKLNAIRSGIRRQLDYYFSDQNYPYDTYLQKLKNADGWIPLKQVSRFNRMRSFTENFEFIQTSIEGLKNVELDDKRCFIRRRTEKAPTNAIRPSHIGPFSHQIVSELPAVLKDCTVSADGSTSKKPNEQSIQTLNDLSESQHRPNQRRSRRRNRRC